MGADEHRRRAGHDPVGVALITVSDTRSPDTDENYHYVRARLPELGHTLVSYQIVKDEPAQISVMLDQMAGLGESVQMIIFNGGTGIAPRDTTFDVIRRMLEKELPGFGELFRMLSYAEVGAAAMLSRATAGVYRGKFVVSTPGSPNAVRLAMEKLILPEINHLAWEVTRKA
ncbi:MAG: molybdenum cofactor biosynthesis protein B [bacterium]|nr:molybdenum cofactor biosynthesis protein B [bacterium]